MNRTSLSHDWHGAVNYGDRRDRAVPDMLVLHYTAMASAQAARHWLCCAQSQVSCHYLIDEAGKIIQMVDEDKRAWHAGLSSWAGLEDINSASIGIEIQNTGHDPFPSAQMEAIIALCSDIIARHRIVPHRVLGHSDVAPGRKIDPGPLFDWGLLYENGVGHWVEPAEIVPGTFFQLGDEGEPVAALQAMLGAYGYGIEITGHFDEQTRNVVTAFQLHFRPARCDGIADISTIETLHRLSV